MKPFTIGMFNTFRKLQYNRELLAKCKQFDLVDMKRSEIIDLKMNMEQHDDCTEFNKREIALLQQEVDHMTTKTFYQQYYAEYVLYMNYLDAMNG